MDKHFLRLFIFVIFSLPLSVCLSSDGAYKDLKFYYGDTHFHSGFSGDNSRDADPLAAFVNALHHVIQVKNNAQSGGDPTEELGGYFLFMSDHAKFSPTRKDMTDELYQCMRHEANDPSLELINEKYTFTVFPGAEITGLARDLPFMAPWDNKFGHLNIFNLKNISNFTTNSFNYLKGITVMDRLTVEAEGIGQFNHSGYNGEPRIGNDNLHLYPYSAARDRVFKFFEISDGYPDNWNIGVAQYNLCLQKGYHVSPVIGSDIHDTKMALSFQRSSPYLSARTVIVAPSTFNMSHEERRKTLLESVRKGMVYASENSNLHIKFSINAFPIGHQFQMTPEHLAIEIDVEDIRNIPLKTIELIQNKACIVADKEVSSEQQCTTLLKEWTSKNDDLNFSNNKMKFHTTYYIESRNLYQLKYIYLKVKQTNNYRAMTTPFFFA